MDKVSLETAHKAANLASLGWDGSSAPACKSVDKEGARRANRFLGKHYNMGVWSCKSGHSSAKISHTRSSAPPVLKSYLHPWLEEIDHAQSLLVGSYHSHVCFTTRS